MRCSNTVSIIIPTLNEDEHIVSLLALLSDLDPGAEIIVCDGGSTDDTVAVSLSHAKVIQTPKGRATQMNAGAKTASGEILWFLHADCVPHPDSILEMRRMLADPAVVGGGFEYSFDGPGLFFRLAENCSNMKNRVLRLLYGDMGIFVRRDVFEKIGGYKSIPLMEDMDICTRLKKIGKIIIIPRTMRTSVRRWREQGMLTTAVKNWILQIAWKLGVSPGTLYKCYYPETSNRRR